MDFLEKFLLSVFAQKAIKSAAASFDKENNRTNSYYKQLRTRYFSMHELSRSMLNNLFLREPDLIEGQTGPDCREFLHIKVSRYIFCGHMIYGNSWFTISANDRFICNDLIDNLMTNNLRDCALIDYSSREFAPIESTDAHSITIGDYTLYFDHPFFYNLTLMLLKDSDSRFRNGETIQSRAVTYPKIFIDESILKQYDISFDEKENAGLGLTNASYAVLNDFNSEILEDRKSGHFELRVVDGDFNKSDSSQPCSIKDILTKRVRVANGSVWLSIAPGMIMDNGHYLLGTQFNFLHSADAVTIRGSEDRLEIYVCRMQKGWGGIKFRVQHKKDYYRLAMWLIPAVAYYCSVVRGWDQWHIIQEYWPTYKPMCDQKREGNKKDTRKFSCALK